MGGKSRKDEYWYNTGFARAVVLLQDKGPEALLKEAKARGITRFEMKLTTEEIERAYSETIRITYETMNIAIAGCLHDSFGFGEKRIKKFFHELKKPFEYITNGWLYWIDAVNDIKERLNLDLSIIADDNALPSRYFRPDCEDLYEDVDLILPAEWNALLKLLEFTEKPGDNGETIIVDKYGDRLLSFKGEYEKIMAYDFLNGMDYARFYYADKKPDMENSEVAQDKVCDS